MYRSYFLYVKYKKCMKEIKYDNYGKYSFVMGKMLIADKLNVLLTKIIKKLCLKLGTVWN